MRVVYSLVLVLLLGAVVVFALQNREPVTVQYFDRSVSLPLSLLSAVVYLAGMVTGWTVVGVVRRSLRGASESPADH